MLLQMHDIHKSFQNAIVLKGVNFDLQAGEVRALLGENGAGKSTLIKILGGIHRADSGTILIDDKKVHIANVQEAHHLGIRIIHQEIVLVPYLSVAENIFLGEELPKFACLMDKRGMLREAQRALDSMELNIKAQETVSHLTIAQQQLVEIVKAVYFKARIIVMDEPTSSLADNEVQKLFATIDRLKQAGVGVIYISHRLAELFQVADQITVLRDGACIGTRERASTDANELISMMVGRELKKFYTRTFNPKGDTILEVKNLSRKSVINNVSFSVSAGEVVGFAGLLGAGRSEIMRAIFGIDRIDGGEVYVSGKKARIKHPKDAISLGIAFVPEDRKKEGLVLENTLSFNLVFLVLSEIISFLHVSYRKKHRIIEKSINDFSIKAYSQNQRVDCLSGGNQQKALIAKWLAIKPKVLILDEPTRGVDVGAKAEIYDIINELAKNGVAVIMVSSELPEIINMCDRTYVVCNGKISGHLDRSEFSQDKIMVFATEEQNDR